MELKEIIKEKNQTGSISLESWFFRQGNLTLYELFCICSIIKTYNPKKILEIGTFDGLTTLHMAINSDPGCEIHTIDLPREKLKDIELNIAGGDKELIEKEGFEIGYHFINHPAGKKIIQHYSDSAKFDVSGYLKNFGFIFIDGAHSYDYIKTDTENSLRMIQDGGVILWHDYGSVIDVTEYLNDLSKKLNIIKILDTSLAFYYLVN